MFRIAVIGGTGYAGAAIAREAARRGHQVTALSRTPAEPPVPGVEHVQGDASDEATLATVIGNADVVVATLAPRGSTAESFRDINRTIARLSDSAGARLFVVGGFSSLRPAPGAERFVTDLSHVPADLQPEIRAGAALILEDLPAAPPTLDWVFVSPPLGFGAHAPAEPTGGYRLGGEVAVDPQGGSISAADYALAVLDLIEGDEHHRTQVNVSV